jgi:hypothetical protein
MAGQTDSVVIFSNNKKTDSTDKQNQQKTAGVQYLKELNVTDGTI